MCRNTVPFSIAAEGDVAAVLRDRRADARVEQFLDGHDDFLVGLVVELAGLLDRRRVGLGRLPITGRPDMKCSMMAPRIAGFRCCHSGPSLVTVMKS